MRINNIKGALLEYYVRILLKNCGFKMVQADGLYTFDRGGLFFINGRGAAHDADVLMNPPVQMPFAFPTRLLFECKAYGPDGDVGLGEIRNALGLRNDINEFEIVTKDSLLQRQNNRRAVVAIEARNRHYYQVGVACVNDFSLPAFEFAMNNKIPLLSLSWFVKPPTIQGFNNLSQSILDGIDQSALENLYALLKDRRGDELDDVYSQAYNLLHSNNPIGRFARGMQEFTDIVCVALIETGDMIFLNPRRGRWSDVLTDDEKFPKLSAEIHYLRREPYKWSLKVFDRRQPNRFMEFEFFIPVSIFNHWAENRFDRNLAIDIKEQMFARIYIFGRNRDADYPYLVVRIDQEFLRNARRQV